MILIADSGATKTDWRLIETGPSNDTPIQMLRTSGMNPYHHSAEQIKEILLSEMLPQLPSLPAQVFFYGAGCGVPRTALLMQQALQEAFPQAQVQVEDDLTAAAHALCGHRPGIACILGTGSGVCLSDGAGNLTKIPGNGIWLGDQGSGARLGLHLLIAYLDNELPADLRQRFEKRFPETDRAAILENVYQKPAPARYLGSFTQFLLQLQNHPWVYRMVYEEFCLFFNKRVKPLSPGAAMPVHATGGVAFYFGNMLRKAAADLGVPLQIVAESPISGLSLYHLPK